MKQSVLVIDDEPSIRTLFVHFLSDAGFDAQAVPSLAAAREVIAARSFDAVIIDQVLPDGRGTDYIGELRATFPEMAIVVIAGMADIPLAVEAMRRGADHFLTKPINLNDLKIFLQRSLEFSSLRRISRAQKLLAKKTQFDFGTSNAMGSLMELTGLAAENESPVLITGETGAGKGVLARWIHENGTRSGGTFVEVNCSSLRGELLASELFGSAKGAYTSAVQDRQGLLDVADWGTLFLDEIGDMDPAVQAQFLKVIEEKSYRRLGEVRERKSDFRLICATNRDLSDGSSQGRFRKDLLYRIQVLPIHVPALRDRREDIAGLVRHILALLNYKYRDIPPAVVSLLESYPWPGNVRELRNVLERALLLARGCELDEEHFPGLRQTGTLLSREPVGELDRIEMDSIKTALERFGGDVAKAAEALGISRSTIYRRLKKNDVMRP